MENKNALMSNINKAYEAYKKEILSAADRDENGDIHDTLDYIEGFIGAIGNCLNTSGGYVDGETIRSRVLDIESHLIAIHGMIGGHCWQVESVTMDLMESLHKVLLEYELYY